MIRDLNARLVKDLKGPLARQVKEMKNLKALDLILEFPETRTDFNIGERIIDKSLKEIGYDISRNLASLTSLSLNLNLCRPQKYYYRKPGVTNKGFKELVLSITRHLVNLKELTLITAP